MKWRPLSKSLRFKLVLASVMVELLMLMFLTINSIRVTENSLLEQTRVRLSELTLLLNTSLDIHMAQRDYISAQEILDEQRFSGGIVYLVLLDNDGKTIASSGWDMNKPLPPLDKDPGLEDDDSRGRFDTEIPIWEAGEIYGTLRYGVSTEFLPIARAHIVKQSLIIAATAVFITILLLAGLSYWLTRGLRSLTEGSESVAEGNFNINLPVKSADEIGQLTRAFNTMAEAVHSRVEALSENEARFHAIADYTFGWENWIGPDGKTLWVNPSVERIIGYTPEECLRMENFPTAVVVPEDAGEVGAACKSALRGTSGRDMEFRVRHKNGSTLWVVADWQSLYDKEGKYLGFRSSIRDITARKEMELALQTTVVELKRAEEKQRQYLAQSRQEQARLTSLLSAMNIGILLVGTQNEVIYYNSAFLRIWMINNALELVGEQATEVIRHSPNVLARPDHFSKYILQVIGTHEISESFEINMADGRVVTQVSYPVRDQDGRFIGRLWVYEDITRERQTAEQLIYLAERDCLTGLYNRHRFQDELGRMLAEAERRRSKAALLFFDLDEFKYINDTFGHRAGDAMLIRVAGEVGTLVRRNEIFSRLGGDEFAVLVPDISESEAQNLAERIVRAVSQIPFRYEGQNLRLTTSVGIALFPMHAANTEDLIAHADAAMYQAKEGGKNTWRIYRPELDASRTMINRMNWNERISHALENNLLRMHFQGVYHTHDGSLSHLEVLVRMVDGDDQSRLILPGHFIPFAEKSGKILDIDRWVLRESISLLSRSEKIPPLAVNISGRSFDEPTLPQYITEQLEYFKVNPKRLHVELTETAAVLDLHDAQRFIEALHQIGCIICLDDFGAGFSSFAYLKHLKADILKIDGIFIRDLPNDRDNQVFVKAMVEVARGLRKITVAEFVENAETLEILKSFGVHMAQGYHLDMPRAEHPAIILP